MIVCLCRGVSDRDVVDAIRCGARSLQEVALRCAGAGTDCGGCRGCIEEYLGTSENESLSA